MIKLYKYQEEAIDKLHDGGILCGSVGSGKSLTALGYYMKNHSDKDLYIITTSRKRDSLEWESDISKIECRSPKAIDSWNNIRKYEQVTGAFFLFDEHKVSGHGKWARRMISIAKRNKWILLTATPGDCWNDYATVFIANGFVKNRTAWNDDFCKWDRRLSYPKIVGYLHEDVLTKMRDEVLVPMHYRSEKVPVPHVIPYDIDTDEEQIVLMTRKSYRHPEMPPFLNISAMLAYIRMNVPVAESKISELQKIIKKHKKIIIFYNFLSEKFEIEDACRRENRIYRQCNGQVHDPVPPEDEWCYAVQYCSGAEGWNAPMCDTMVFYSLNYSYKITTQAMGRIDRCNSPFEYLQYYYFVAPEFKIDQKILECLIRKEEFNEVAFANEDFVGYEEDEGEAFAKYLQSTIEHERSTSPYRSPMFF